MDSQERFIDAAWERYGERLTFQEIRRGVQALSGLYVHRRQRVRDAVFDGAGKRAAFALVYAPLHLEIVRQVAEALVAAGQTEVGQIRRIVDLGCGTGAAGVGWALACPRAPEVVGIERNGWAAAEARWTLSSFGLRGRVLRGDVGAQLPRQRAGHGAGVLAAWTLNELPEQTRARVEGELLAAAERGAVILVVEPIARSAVPWWDAFAARVASAGGHAEAFEIEPELPRRVVELSRAAGLDHRAVRCRTLTIGGRRGDRA